MLRDYYDRDANQWAKCPDCQDTSKQFTPYFKCGWCGYTDKKDIAYQANKLEKPYHDIIKEMVKHLLPSGTPMIDFSETANPPSRNYICAGWADGNNNTITIPKKLFYLPHDEITDTTAHESAHIPTWNEEPPLGWDPDHGPEWLNTYHKFRDDLFSLYQVFINSSNPNARFTKGYKIKNKESYYDAEYGIKKELKYDPNED